MEISIVSYHDPLPLALTTKARHELRPTTATYHHRLVVNPLIMSNPPPNVPQGLSREDATIKSVLLWYPRRSTTCHPWWHCCFTVQPRLGPRRDRPQKRSHGLFARSDLAGTSQRHLLPFLDPDLPIHVWGFMHPLVALWERPRPSSYEHPLVKRWLTPRRDGSQHLLLHPCR